MYFLIACSDDPPRSFKLLMAPFTISEVGGCVGFDRGFFAFFSDAAAAAFFDGVVAVVAGDEVVCCCCACTSVISSVKFVN
jgi:hypothetical protein